VDPIEPFVDIHCHLVPGIDDGAKNWDETLAMARLAVADGIQTIVVTPHQLGSFSHNDGPTIRQRTEELQQFLSAEQVPLTVLPGADVRIEAGMVEGLRSGRVMSLADRRRHVLLELPHEMYMPLEHLLGELKAAAMVGILSHPERNRGILGRQRLIRPLVEAGCLMQVTADSLTGAFGSQVEQFACWLVSEGLVHFVSTDAHGVKSRRPLMRPAFDRVAELAGHELALELCCRNPAAVAAGRAVAAGPRKVRRPQAAGWFGWKRAG
jgi:protein-tyrosine phosphatase